MRTAHRIFVHAEVLVLHKQKSQSKAMVFWGDLQEKTYNWWLKQGISGDFPTNPVIQQW